MRRVFSHCLIAAAVLLLAGAPRGARAADTEIGGPILVAGSTTLGTTDDTTGTGLGFNFPRACAFDPAGNLYVADRSNFAIRKITVSADGTTYSGSTFVGLIGTSGSTDGTGTAARIGELQGLTLDAAGTTMYATDYSSHVVRAVDLASGATTLYAGASGTSCTTDGVGAAARFNGPGHLASGVAYVADYTGHRIRSLDTVTTPGNVATVAGSTAGSTDSPALFNGPIGVAVRQAGALVYVSDYNNHTIRTVTSGGTTATVGGTGAGGYLDGTGVAAQFNGPEGVTLFAHDRYLRQARLRRPDGLAGGPAAPLIQGTSMVCS